MGRKEKTVVSRAIQLKNEGNTFFERKQYRRALEKYTQAMQEDEKSAVIHTNRAACLLAMKRYHEAVIDARKATLLDPTYGKAWARYAAALEELDFWPEAHAAWKRALETLPIENPSMSDQKQREQYSAKLAHTRHVMDRHIENRGADINGTLVMPGSAGLGLQVEHPWTRAEAILPKLHSFKEKPSSAWIIHDAYSQFSLGSRLFRYLETDDSGHEIRQLDAIEHLTNGIVRDSRSIHMSEFEWLEKCWEQVEFEMAEKGGWEDEDIDVVLQKAEGRLQAEDWDSVRPALAITAQRWILLASMPAQVGEPVDEGAAIKWWDLVTELLYRGREKWEHVSDDVRGGVFEFGYVNAVKMLRLKCYVSICFRAKKADELQQSHADKLLALAQDILGDPEDLHMDIRQQDPAVYSACYAYPLAQALAAKGLYYKTQVEHETDVEVLKEIQNKVITLYTEASTLLPLDDENRHYYICCALSSTWIHGTHVSVIFYLVNLLKIGLQEMRYLWETSGLSLVGRDNEIDRFLELGLELEARLAKGEITEQDLVKTRRNPHGNRIVPEGQREIVVPFRSLELRRQARSHVATV